MRAFLAKPSREASQQLARGILRVWGDGKHDNACAGQAIVVIEDPERAWGLVLDVRFKHLFTVRTG
jgi:hypothetical protein